MAGTEPGTAADTARLESPPRCRAALWMPPTPAREGYVAGLERAGIAVLPVEDRTSLFQTLVCEMPDALVAAGESLHADGLAMLGEVCATWPWLVILVLAGPLSGEDLQAAEAAGATVLRGPAAGEGRLAREVLAAFDASTARYAEARRGALAALGLHAARLAQLGNGALHAANLGATLARMADRAASFLPGDAVALYGGWEGEQAMVIAQRTPATPAAVQALQAETLRRFSVFGGQPPDPARVRVTLSGRTPTSAGIPAYRHLVAAPLAGRGCIHGVLVTASASAEPPPPADRMLALLVGSHLAAILDVLAEMRRLASRDPLTGILNRLGLEDTLDRTWLISRRYGFSMAVVAMDIDYFKNLNDAYGHTVGDKLIAEFGNILGQVARVSDVVARYGGDEFVAILPQADEHAARAFGERLLARTRQQVFCRDRERLRLTISLGIATSTGPTAPATSAALLSQADRALYMAKRAGRDRLCIWPGIIPAHDSPAGTPAAGAAGVPAAVDVGRHGRVAVVDDEAAVRDVVKALLERDNFEVTAFASATEALQVLRGLGAGHVDIVLTDISMPGKSGLELLHDLAAWDATVVKVVMTGYATVDNAVVSLREGAYDFIQKPVDRKQLLAVAHRALEYRRLKLENARYQSHLEDLVRERSGQLAESLEQIKKAHEFTLEAMVAMLDAREKHTARHSLCVAELAVTLGRHMGQKGEDLEVLASGALLHDIGKISIPDAILLKPGPLSAAEWEIMRRHPQTGYDILRTNPYLRAAAELVRAHHERFDGAGYPRGLRGDAICLGSRIFAVIDAYEAMRSNRPYRASFAPPEAVAEIRRNAGTQFDPVVVEAFRACQQELEDILQAGRE